MIPLWHAMILAMGWETSFLLRDLLSYNSRVGIPPWVGIPSSSPLWKLGEMMVTGYPCWSEFPFNDGGMTTWKIPSNLTMGPRGHGNDTNLAREHAIKTAIMLQFRAPTWSMLMYVCVLMSQHPIFWLRTSSNHIYQKSWSLELVSGSF